MLNKIIKKNGSFQLLSILVGFFVQISFVYIWGQNLSKEEIGLISIVSVVTSFGLLFSSLGVTNYILYKQELSSHQIEAINNLMLLVSFFICLLVVIFGYFSYFLLSLNIKHELFIAAVIFPLIGVGITSQALLVRDKRLNDIAKIEIVSKLISLFSFFLLVQNEKSAKVYFIAQAIMWLIKSFGFTLFARTINSFKLCNFDFKSLVGFMPFLKSLIFGQVLNTFSQKIDEVIFAIVFSVEKLGIYYSFKQMAMQLSSMYYNLIRRLFLPYLAESKSSSLYKSILEKSTFVYTLCLFVVLSLHVYFFEYIFNVSFSKENIYLYFFAFLFVYLKYISGNIQTAFCQVVGEPMMELKWNLVQFFIIVAPISIVTTFFNIKSDGFILMQLFFSYVLFIVSSCFFKNNDHKIRTFLIFFPSFFFSILYYYYIVTLI